MNLKTLILSVFVCCSSLLQGQRDSIDWSSYLEIVEIDSLIVYETRRTLGVADFIEYMKTDTSFYQAFKELRLVEHTANVSFDAEHGRKGFTYTAAAKQRVDEQKCRKTVFDNETASKGFFEDKDTRDYTMYTAQLLDRLFYTHKSVCAGTGKASAEPKGIEKHVKALKDFMFKPALGADVPFIGDKTNVFTPKMQKYYDYSIVREQYKGVDVYTFIVELKPAFVGNRQQTVVRYLKTYFNRDDMQVIGRTYQLKYAKGVYDFDVEMGIDIEPLGDKYVPKVVSYKGTWDVVMKKRETADFTLNFDYE